MSTVIKKLENVTKIEIIPLFKAKSSFACEQKDPTLMLVIHSFIDVSNANALVYFHILYNHMWK